MKWTVVSMHGRHVVIFTPDITSLFC